MMISTASVAGVGYYTGGGSDEARQGAAPNYYTGASDKGEPSGQWSGHLATALGLSGVVDHQDMQIVFERFQAPYGSPIGNAPRNYGSLDERVQASLAL